MPTPITVIDKHLQPGRNLRKKDLHKHFFYNLKKCHRKLDLFNLRNALHKKTKNQHLTLNLTTLKQNFLFHSSNAPRLVFYLIIHYFYLLYLPTQIRFLIGGERVTCHGSNLHDAQGRTKLHDALGKQQLELSTRTRSGRAP